MAHFLAYSGAAALEYASGVFTVPVKSATRDSGATRGVLLGIYSTFVMAD